MYSELRTMRLPCEAYLFSFFISPGEPCAEFVAIKKRRFSAAFFYSYLNSSTPIKPPPSNEICGEGFIVKKKRLSKRKIRSDLKKRMQNGGR